MLIDIVGMMLAVGVNIFFKKDQEKKEKLLDQLSSLYVYTDREPQQATHYVRGLFGSFVPKGKLKIDSDSAEKPVKVN